jgi:nitroreductase
MGRTPSARRRQPGRESVDRVSDDFMGQQIFLPKPTAGRATSVSEALRRRRTNRAISERKLSLQMLSNLLSAAFGMNRKEGPFGIVGRTAASASNSQEIVLYVALEEGLYLYDPALHRLTLVRAEDLRALAIGKGQGGAGAKAPVRLIYAVDIGKFSTAGFQEPGLQDPETQKAYYYVDTGLIAGNLYLFAAAQGLATWFHNCNKAELSVKLELENDQRVLFGQTIGYPEKA